MLTHKTCSAIPKEWNIKHVTMHLSSCEIHAKTCVHVGIHRQKNINQVPVIIVLNRIDHATSGPNWRKVLNDIAVRLAHQGIHVAEADVSTHQDRTNHTGSMSPTWIGTPSVSGFVETGRNFETSYSCPVENWYGWEQCTGLTQAHFASSDWR